MSKEQIYREAAENIIRSGFLPIQVNDTVLELMAVLMNEEQAALVAKFKKPMLLRQMVKLFGQDEETIRRILDELMYIGVIMGVANKKSGNMIYRPLPILPGIFEYTLMRGRKGEKEKRLAQLYEKIFAEFTDDVQQNYDAIVPQLEKTPPFTRVVPINEAVVEQPGDTVYPLEDVMKIVDKFDTIALTHCYCRTEKDLLDKPCKVTDERRNCLVFGKSAEFTIAYEYGEQISKEQAKEILAKANQEGLVHKSFHQNQDVEKDEFALCNCCKCCCQTFGMYSRGMAPSHNYSSYLAEVDEDACVNCGECVETCPMEMISLEEGSSAVVDETGCIGCGVCVMRCPADALLLKRTENRAVLTPPARRK